VRVILSRPIGILRPAPMSSPTVDLTRLLVQINAPGSFATRRTAPCTDLRLDVKGVGRLKLPLQTRSFCGQRPVCKQAPPANGKPFCF
jgi:hypothetical protein